MPSECGSLWFYTSDPIHTAFIFMDIPPTQYHIVCAVSLQQNAGSLLILYGTYSCLKGNFGQKLYFFFFLIVAKRKQLFAFSLWRHGLEFFLNIYIYKKYSWNVHSSRAFLKRYNPTSCHATNILPDRKWVQLSGLHSSSWLNLCLFSTQTIYVCSISRKSLSLVEENSGHIFVLVCVVNADFTSLPVLGNHCQQDRKWGSSDCKGYTVFSGV